jgi:hypothetical protein
VIRYAVHITARPSAQTIETVRVLLAGAACALVGARVEAGLVSPEAYELEATRAGEHMLKVITEEQPPTASTAHMVARAVRLAGGVAEVVEVSS